MLVEPVAKWQNLEGESVLVSICYVGSEHYGIFMTTGSDVPGCKPLGLSLPIVRPSDHDGGTQQQTGECHLVCHFTSEMQIFLKNSNFSVVFIILQDCPLSVMERSVYSARHCFVENLHIK